MDEVGDKMENDEILKIIGEQVIATNELICKMNDELEIIGKAANAYMHRVKLAVQWLLAVLIIQLFLMVYSMAQGGLM